MATENKSTLLPLEQLEYNNQFTHSHIGSDQHEQQAMLECLGFSSLAELINETVPETIRLNRELELPGEKTEQNALAEILALAQQNTVNKSYIGMGYYNTEVPNVILRNLLENPAWYTAYTPYQPEISQGRLEMLLNFQQMVMDLTGMEIANASLLDEATAAAEAMTLCFRSVGRKKAACKTFFVADDVHPQVIGVIKTRADWLGIKVVVGNPHAELDDQDVFGVHIQYPGTYGNIPDVEGIVSSAKKQGAMASVGTDLLALMLMKSPGELGADIVVGNSQRFGVPMGFGGPHAAFFATTAKLKRSVPGRIIGVSKDSRGNTALRMAMQTREQHIRREKANSNICTAQALLANMAAAYAVYHGPEKLKGIAERVHRLTRILHQGLTEMGFKCNHTFFDTLTFKVGSEQENIYQRALSYGCNLRRVGTNRLGVSLDETTRSEDIINLFSIFMSEGKALNVDSIDRQITANNSQKPHTQEQLGLSEKHRRTDEVLSHEVFNSHHFRNRHDAIFETAGK